MKKKIFIISACVCLCMAMSACAGNTQSATDTASKGEDAKNEIVYDNSFNTGVEKETARETLKPEEADFRNLRWGMTKDEVIYAEGTGYSEPDKNTLYYTRVREEDFPADAEYIFEDEKLTQATFYITENKQNEKIKIANFDEIVESFKKRFGEPTKVEVKFFNETEKTDNLVLHEEYILKNKLQYRTGWFLEGLDLRVVLHQRNGVMCIGLQYKAPQK